MARKKKRKNKSQVIDIEEARKQRRQKRKNKKEKVQEKAKQKQKVSSSRKVVRSRRRRLILLVLFVVFLLIVLLTVFNIINLKAKEREVQAELDALNDQKARLEAELERVGTPEFIEQQAREIFGMIRSGETLYIPEEDTEGDLFVQPSYEQDEDEQ